VPTLNKPFNNHKLVEALGALGREAGAVSGAV